MIKKLLLVLGCFLVTVKSLASVLPDSTEQKKKLSLTPLPAFFVSPETGVGLGGLVVPVYNFGSDSLTRNSNGQILSYYTQKKQFGLQLNYNVYTNREQYILNGEASYFDFPILYYGTGNRNVITDSSLLSYKFLLFQNRLVKQVKKNFFLGGQFQVSRTWDIEFDKLRSKLTERPEKELIGYYIAGIGPALILDSRDNPLNATKGRYVETGIFINHKTLGSDFNFNRIGLDIRTFKELKPGQVLAFQGIGTFSTGSVPFRELANLGGGKTMRGFYLGRFRDRQLIAAQTEYRRQIWSRLGVAAFGGLGKVAPDFENLAELDFKYAGGAGLRFMLNRKERLNIRIDYAVGSDKSSGLYFAIGEAF